MKASKGRLINFYLHGKQNSETPIKSLARSYSLASKRFLDEDSFVHLHDVVAYACGGLVGTCVCWYSSTPNSTSNEISDTNTYKGSN
jgi:hypothetical protein